MNDSVSIQGRSDDREASRRLLCVRGRLAISKRDLLLFDDLDVLRLNHQLDGLHRTNPELLACAEYLAESDFLHSGPDSVDDLVRTTDGLLHKTAHNEALLTVKELLAAITVMDDLLRNLDVSRLTPLLLGAVKRRLLRGHGRPRPAFAS